MSSVMQPRHIRWGIREVQLTGGVRIACVAPEVAAYVPVQRTNEPLVENMEEKVTY